MADRQNPILAGTTKSLRRVLARLVRQAATPEAAAPRFDMTGNTVLITGGGSGIGNGLARALLARGNRVVIAGRRLAVLEAAAARTPGLEIAELDVTDTAALPRFAERLRASHPGLNMLINNAGIMQTEDLLAQSGDTRVAETTIATNLIAPIQLVSALLPQLTAQPKAAIINVTSGLAFLPLAMTPTYSATKAALHAYTQCLRHQLRKTSVRVLEIAPPAVKTELMPGLAEASGSMALDDFIAQTMAGLASPPASGEILVKQVEWLRRAEAEGQFAERFAVMNGR